MTQQSEDCCPVFDVVQMLCISMVAKYGSNYIIVTFKLRRDEDLVFVHPGSALAIPRRWLRHGVTASLIQKQKPKQISHPSD